MLMSYTYLREREDGTCEQQTVVSDGPLFASQIDMGEGWMLMSRGVTDGNLEPLNVFIDE